MLFVIAISAYIINSIPPTFIWKYKIPAYDLLCIFVEFGFLALILVPLYRKWDLRPIRERELSFAKMAIVPMIILAFPVVWMVSS